MNYPAGYSVLFEQLGMDKDYDNPVFCPDTCHSPVELRPPIDHILFAMKHERVNWSILSRAISALSDTEVVGIVGHSFWNTNEDRKYKCILGFIWERLCKKTINYGEDFTINIINQISHESHQSYWTYSCWNKQPQSLHELEQMIEFDLIIELDILRLSGDSEEGSPEFFRNLTLNYFSTKLDALIYIEEVLRYGECRYFFNLTDEETVAATLLINKERTTICHGSSIPDGDVLSFINHLMGTLPDAIADRGAGALLRPTH